MGAIVLTWRVGWCRDQGPGAVRACDDRRQPAPYARGHAILRRTARAPDRVRHPELPLQPGADRLRACATWANSVSRRGWSTTTAAQGQSMGGDRPARCSGHRALRPYRRRARGRPGLDRRSVPRPVRGRPHLWPGCRRHEGLPRLCPGVGAGAGRGPAAPARDPGLLLRRGGRLQGRAAADRGDPGRAAAARGLPDRRAHADAAGRRPQGQGGLSLHRHRPGGALGLPGTGRQRGRGRRPAHPQVAAMGDRFAAEGPFSEGFDPPHHTSGVGRIEGGSQLNIIPSRCSFEFEFRALPGEDPLRFVREVEAFAAEAVLPALRATAPEAAIALRGGPGLSWSAPGRHAVRPAVPRAHRHRGAGQGLVRHRRRLLCARGVPSVVCGPGDIAVAHKPDEWIAVEQLERCELVLARAGADCPVDSPTTLSNAGLSAAAVEAGYWCPIRPRGAVRPYRAPVDPGAAWSTLLPDTEPEAGQRWKSSPISR